MGDEEVKIELKQILKGHEGEVNNCDFGPRDKILATASSDRTVRLWHLSEDQTEYGDPEVLRHHSLSVNQVRFSPQGTMLATCSVDGTSVVWDLSTLSPLCSFVHPSGLGLRVCAFSPDASQLLTAGDDGIVCLWDIGSRSLKRTLKVGDESGVLSADFSPDGQLIVSGTEAGNLYFWDGIHSFHAKYLVQIEVAHDLAVLSCHFAPRLQGTETSGKNYTLATSGNDGFVRTWIIRTSDLDGSLRIEPDHVLDQQTQSVMSVRFSRDANFLVATGGDKLISVYDMKSCNIAKCLEHHQRHVGTCEFSRSGSHLATGSNDRTVVIWSFGKPADVMSLNPSDFASREESSRLTVKAAKEEAVLAQNVACHLSDVNALVFVDNNQLISCSGDKTIRSWKKPDPDGNWFEDDSKSQPMCRCRYGVTSASFCQKSRLLATATLDGQIILWNTKDFEQVTVFTTPDDCSVRVCQLSPDGNLLIAAGDGDVAHVWNLATLSLSHSLIGHEATIFVSCFTSDSSMIVTGCNNGVLKLWPNEVDNDNSKTTAPNFSKKVKPCDLIRDAHDMGITCGECSPIFDWENSSTVFVSGGNDSLIKVWKISVLEPSLKLTRSLEGHGSSAMSVRFSSDGKFFASTSGDKTCRLWSSDLLTCLTLLEGHTRFLACCAFSPDGCSFSTGSNDKLIKIWKLSGRLVFPYQSDTSQNELKEEKEVPHEFICPITQDVMKWPVWCEDGFVYERAAIHEWLVSRRQTSPMTNLPVANTDLVPQEELREAIQEYFTNLN